MNETEAAFARVCRDAASLREALARAINPCLPKGCSLKITQLVVHNGAVDQDSIVLEVRAVTEKKQPAFNAGRFIAGGVKA